MNRVWVVKLTGEELKSLYEILVKRDGDGALEFLDRHLKSRAEAVFESG